MGGRGGSSRFRESRMALPKLEGSEKQVKWATEIRDRYIVRLKEVMQVLYQEEGDKRKSARSNLAVLVNADNPRKIDENNIYYSYTEYTRKEMLDDVKKNIRFRIRFQRKKGAHRGNL